MAAPNANVAPGRPVNKRDKVAVLAQVLTNGSAGKDIPAEVLNGTPNDLRVWINDNFLQYQGDIAIVTVDRIFERRETRTSTTTEK